MAEDPFRRRRKPLFRRAYRYQRTHVSDHPDLLVVLVMVLIGLAIIALLMLLQRLG